MLYYRQAPNLSQTNLNEIYASQTASIERGGHPDMEFFREGIFHGLPCFATDDSLAFVICQRLPLPSSPRLMPQGFECPPTNGLDDLILANGARPL